LNFNTNSASEIFQKVISEQIRHIPGVLNISDDVIVFGKTQAEHDDSLNAVFCKLAEVNLTLNKYKCAFNKSRLTFFGFVFSSKGIVPDTQKIETINNASPPTSTSAVRSFLGIATYCTKFIPNFSDVSEPLRQLTKKDVPFVWEDRHQKSFIMIKQLFRDVMAYFDPSKKTELITDASPSGLSTILVQSTNKKDRQVVVYTSRAVVER